MADPILRECSKSGTRSHRIGGNGWNCAATWTGAKCSSSSTASSWRGRTATSCTRAWTSRFPTSVCCAYGSRTAPPARRSSTLTRDGHPLPGSEGDPANTIWLTVSIFWCLAALQVFFAGAVVRYGNVDQTVYAIGAAGLVLALLGILAWRRSYPAM